MIPSNQNRGSVFLSIGSRTPVVRYAVRGVLYCENFMLPLSIFHNRIKSLPSKK